MKKCFVTGLVRPENQFFLTYKWKRTLSVASVLVGSFWLLLPTTAAAAQGEQATDTSYLKEMPDTDRVLADIHGSDSLDTAARQRAALEILSDVVVSFARTEGLNLRLTPEEMELNGRYNRAFSDIISATYHTVDPNNQQQLVADSPRVKWNQLHDQYRKSENFIRDLLQRYLSPRNRDRYLEILRQRRQQMASFRAEGAKQKAKEEQFQATIRAEQAEQEAKEQQRKRNLAEIARGRATIERTTIIIIIVLLTFAIRLIFRKKANSEYRQTQDGSGSVFEVTPSKAPRNNYVFGGGVLFIVMGLTWPVVWFTHILGHVDDPNLPFIAMMTGIGVMFMWLACHNDRRPRKHRSKSSFRVTPDSVEVTGKAFKRDDIHRLIIKNGMSGSVLSSSYMAVSNNAAGQLSYAGVAASAAYEARCSAIAHELVLEAGGKAYLLAGGMDDATAFGLLKDVSKVVGFNA